MNRRLLTVLGFAFVVALGATLLFYGLISSRLGGGGPAVATKEIVVAARDLQRGVLLKDADLNTVPWAAQSLPKGAFTDRKEVVGRGVVSEMTQGEPVLDARLAPKESGAGLAPSIPIGKRAVSLRVNDVVAVAGYVIPGSRVDVLITGNVPGQNQQGPELRTVLQNVEVLAAGANITRDAEGKPISVPVITLLVTPEDAETLSLASNETRIQLVLRNPLDGDKKEPPGTVLTRLFRGGAPPSAPKPAGAPRPKKVEPKVEAPPPPPPPPPPIVVELLRGPARSAEKFQTPEEQPQQRP